MDTVESIESKVADLIGESIPTPSWEDVLEDIKYLCQYTCEGEYNNYQEWKEYNNGDDGYGHIYELAKRIQEYFDPPDDDIPF